ncbi:MAG: hypothetical protein HYW26_05485 [Candidatus Aenigmarchaeota archaeon]|nr:hypothetical protein [Candidatus Aenigmarchaeota archaeon]
MAKVAKEKIFTYVLAGAIAVLVAVLLWSLLQPAPDYYGASYERAKQSKLSDKCATPSGYTDAQWREHMGHHPDQYAECFK